MRRGASLRRCLLMVRAMSDAIAKAQRYRERAGECLAFWRWRGRRGAAIALHIDPEQFPRPGSFRSRMIRQTAEVRGVAGALCAVTSSRREPAHDIVPQPGGNRGADVTEFQKDRHPYKGGTEICQLKRPIGHA